MADEGGSSVDERAGHGPRPGEAATVATDAGELPGARHAWYLRVLPYLGPAFIASVAYIDPGNFATNIQSGAQFGYLLIWVILMSNLMAMLIQSLSAKLGIATGRNLAEICRDRFPRRVVYGMWALSEVVAMATDLAEFLGAAIGFNLLFHIPLLLAGLLTGVATFLILGLERYGFRPLEAVITVFVGIIALSYLVEVTLARPNWGLIAHDTVVPHLNGSESLVLAVGILGATVMPHVIFLHSSLTQNRIVPKNADQARRIFRFEVLDVLIAMGVAGFVNAAMLIMAAATFHVPGLENIASIEVAHKTLAPLLGSASSTIFAVSLLASGLSSSTVGTMAGQVVMQGFLDRHIPVILRRGITMLPALIVIAVGLDPTRTLVVSQVILSFGIPFALIPLVLFTRSRQIMGPLVNGTWTTRAAWLVAGIIVLLNLYLLVDIVGGVL
ncbi:MAG TPA: Nramp family divalent metal transporter [Thermomicrobiaceae bacterium]|nr:Nramp family divalent metal transporter [Thermomicrobiaceae bacterium]